jgi:hypothetical protein
MKFFHDTLGSVAEQNQSVIVNEEMQIYFSERILPRETDIIDWWKCNCNRFPILAATARQYLAIPATQTSSKRLFSDAGNIVTATRTKLISEHVSRTIMSSAFKFKIK